MSPAKEWGWLYFGCDDGPGHRLYGPNMRPAPNAARGLCSFDGAFAPQDDRRANIAALTRLGGHGYSALSWWDYTADKRGGSNIIVYAPSLVVSATSILLGLERFFPQVWRRLGSIDLSACEPAPVAPPAA